MSDLPLNKFRTPRFEGEIPNDPFGTGGEPDIIDINIKTTDGFVVIENAIVRENSVKVDPQSFLEGGFDLGNF